MLKLGKLFYLILTTVQAQAFGSDFEFYSQQNAAFDNLETFTTFGQCQSLPQTYGHFLCNPAYIPTHRTGFEAVGFLAASQKVIDASDVILAKNVDQKKIQEMVEKFRYGEIKLNTHLTYVQPGFLVSVQPKAINGQLVMRNPNLPLASIVVRDGFIARLGTGYNFKVEKASISFGAIGKFTSRKETIIESSLADVAANDFKDLRIVRKQTGFHADLGAHVDIPKIATAAVQFKNLGSMSNSPNYNSYLYVAPDYRKSLIVSAAITPSLWNIGYLHLGLSFIKTFESDRRPGDYLFTTANLLLGPFRFYSSFRKDFLRTALYIKQKSLTAGVGQEWVNNLSLGKNESRLVLEVGAEL